MKSKPYNGEFYFKCFETFSKGNPNCVRLTFEGFLRGDKRF